MDIEPVRSKVLKSDGKHIGSLSCIPRLRNHTMSVGPFLKHQTKNVRILRFLFSNVYILAFIFTYRFICI